MVTFPEISKPRPLKWSWLFHFSKKSFDKLADGKATSPAILSKFCGNPADSGRKICKAAIFPGRNPRPWLPHSRRPRLEFEWPQGLSRAPCVFRPSVKPRPLKWSWLFVKAFSQPPSVEPFGQKASAVLKSISDSAFKGFPRQNGDKRLQAFPILPAECRREPKRFVRCRPPSKADAHGALQEIRRTACQTLRAKGRMRLSDMNSVHRAKRPGAAKSIFSVQQNRGATRWRRRVNFHGQTRFPAKREARNEPPDVGLAGTIACAHAFVTGATRVTILARLHLDALQRTIVAVIAVEHTALYAATNIRIGILLIHNPFLPKYICPETSLFFPRLRELSVPLLRKYLHMKLLTKFAYSAIILSLTVHAPLAQLVEHLTLNQGVQGSSP